MPHISSRWLAALSLLVGCAASLPSRAATRPRYGGTLHVEVRESVETAEPPQSGPGMPDLNGPFTVTRWEAGRRAVYAAEESAREERPFLDAVEVEMGRPLREQLSDLELGKADVVEVGASQARRLGGGRRAWASAPVRVIALVFGAKVEDARVREALALAVNRTAIRNVLFQGQGEVSGALLPQWISGYAFLFDVETDLARARRLAVSAAPAARTFTLGAEDGALRPVADRIALNARDAGLMVTVAAQGAAADVRLLQVRIAASDGPRALAGIAASLRLAAPPRADTPEALYAVERALLEGFRVVPLLHLPEIYGVAPRVKGGTGISPLGEWRFENLWVEK